MAKKQAIQIIVGGQYGSCAKGAIAAHLCRRHNVNIAVRTGATNAGHTVHYVDVNGVPGRIAMQQLPVGWVNPNTQLVLGAGALIDLDILQREIAAVSAITGTDINDRLYVDYRAYIHHKTAHERSAQSGRHHAIGATGKGCSEALMDRIRLRGVEDYTIGHEFARGFGVVEGISNHLHLWDTERLLNDEYDRGALIQLEGTQGQLLDLYLGPYPFTTHKQTGPAQWLLECGLSPALLTNITMVVRTHPIRVAGNSGPLPGEISWPELARDINRTRERAGLDAIVPASAIAEFESAVCQAVIDSGLTVPAKSDGLDMHWWSAKDRDLHRIAASELNAIALSNLSRATVDQLTALFEMTTVTKKLRRIARMDYATLRVAARQIRPHQVALTFLNYTFPDAWGTNAPLTDVETDYCAKVSAICSGATVTMTNRGPLPSAMIDCNIS